MIVAETAKKRVGVSVLVLFLLALPAGCGDDVQGDLKLLLTPPQRGRNPLPDAFAFVERVEASLLDEALDLSSLGSISPHGGRRLDFGLVSSGKSGSLMLLGLNQHGRKVSHGYGPRLSLESGIDSTLTVFFSQYNTAVASKAPLQPGVGLAERFIGLPASIYLDVRDLESGQIAGPHDLSALATLAWCEDIAGGPGGELLIEVTVRDDKKILAPGAVLTEGDAIKIYLQDTGIGVIDIVTVSRDARYESTRGIGQPELSETGYGTWEMRLVLPLAAAGKTRELYFDLTVFDWDEGEDPVRASWSFNPAFLEEELQPDEFGRLVLGVPVLHALSNPERMASFAGPGGEVVVSGYWDTNSLALSAYIPDGLVWAEGAGEGDLSGTDRLELLFDLNNGLPQPVVENRFVGIAVNAGGQKVFGAGYSPADLVASNFEFTGSAHGAIESGGYRVEIMVPWQNLGMNPAEVTFLGVEMRVLDENNTVTAFLSGTSELNSDLWPVIRMYELE